MKTLFIKEKKINLYENIKRLFNIQNINFNIVQADEKIPPLESNEVLIKTLFCGVCPTEIKKIIDPKVLDELSKKLNRRYGDYYPGHEVVGRISEVGSGMNKNLIDKIVTVGDINICRAFKFLPECSNCKKGRGIICKSKSKIKKNKNKKIFGGFSDFFIRSEGQFLVLDEKINKLNATFIEPLSSAIHCESKLSKKNDYIIINGLSTISILFYRYLIYKNYNLNKIFFVVENNFEKKEAIKKKINNVFLGLDDLKLKSDIFFDFIGKYRNINKIFQSLHSNGEVYLFGFEDKSIIVDTDLLINNEITVSGLHGYSSRLIDGKYILDLNIASEMISKNYIYVEDLVSDIQPLSKSKQVLEKICRSFISKKKIKEVHYRTIFKS